MEKMRVDPAAAGVAAYDLVQKIFLLLVERGALSVDDAQTILRDSIDAQSRIMDTEWAPVNEAAAMLLTRISGAVHRQHRATKRKHLKLEIEDVSDRSTGGK